MKLRIKGNTIRLRLLVSEVETLAAGGCCVEYTDFGDRTLTYLIDSKPLGQTIRATFIGDTIAITIGAADLPRWANSDLVSLEQTQSLPQGGSLHLLVEKDFVCMDTSIEDQSDNFPNPKLTSI